MENSINTPISIADAQRGKARQFGLMLVRAVAIMLVVLDHTCPKVGTSAANPSEGLFTLVHTLICNPNAVLFFVLSGALLLPMAGSWREFYRKRIGRLIIPLIVWSTVSAAMHYFLDTGQNAWYFWFELRWMFVGSFAWGAAWFLLVLVGIYVMMPVISPWLRSASRRQIELLLLLWLLSGTLPYLNYLIGLKAFENTSLGMFWSYLGFPLAGYYLVHYPISHDSAMRRWLTIGSLTAICVVAPVVLYFYKGNFDIVDLSTRTNLVLPTMGLACLYFIALSAVKSLGKPLNWVVNLIGRNAFGIYLCHHLVIHGCLRQWTDLYGTWWLPAVTLICSLILAVALRHIPVIGKHIV